MGYDPSASYELIDSHTLNTLFSTDDAQEAVRAFLESEDDVVLASFNSDGICTGVKS